MGEDKSLLPFASSKSLTQYQYDRLKPYFKNIYLSSKINKFDFINNEKIIFDENKDIFSPILALQTIFKELNNQKNKTQKRHPLNLACITQTLHKTK